jgi:uncharacterized protein YjiK
MNFILLFIFLFSLPHEKIQTLKYTAWASLRISDASGITKAGNNYYIANDKGGLYEVDGMGKIIRYKEMGWDNEDICFANGKLYVTDESARRIFVVDTQTLKTIAIHVIQYAGPRNLGLESLAYIADKHEFVAISEKQPSVMFVMNENFNVLNQFRINGFDDISGATYYDHRLYILSDEDHVIIKVDPDKLTPDDFTWEKKWNIPIYNPEGICFDEDGTMRIVSDQCRRLYIFPNPDKQ